MSRLNLNNEDYLNLMLIYGECSRVMNRAVRTFQERYPDRPKPSRDTIRRLIRNLREHGSFTKKVVKGKPVTDNEDNNINVMAYFTAYPVASLKEAVRDLDISSVSIFRILHKFKFHPYKNIRVQHLKQTDFAKRLELCETIMVKMQEDHDFLSKVIWTDEARITKNGIFNRRNCHYWSDSNPHAIRERSFQESWSFNIFCALRNDQVVAVHTYDENLTGNH